MGVACGVCDVSVSHMAFDVELFFVFNENLIYFIQVQSISFWIPVLLL